MLTAANLEKLRKVATSFRGRPYDARFEWSDQRIYCSELVWKVYKRALGIELGPLERMGSFDVSHPEVQRWVRRRYGGKLPTEERVVTPAALFSSPKLLTVYRN